MTEAFPRLADPDRDAAPPRPEPPYNIPVEQALLGAILANNEALHRVSGFLDAEHFFEPAHGRIYAACRRLIENHQRASAVTLAHFFERDEGLKEVGGAQYLAKLVASVVSVLDIEDYGRTTYDLAKRREVIAALESATADAYDRGNELNTEQMIGDVVAELHRIAEGGPDTGASTDLGLAAEAAIQAAQDIANGKVEAGMKTELVDLDHRLGGLKAQALIVLAARPSMGKTALAARIASRAAQRQPDKVVAYFSLEEGAGGLAARLLSARTGIPYEDILNGRADAQQLEQLARAQAAMPRNLVIDETGGITFEAVRARTLRLNRRHQVALVVVDHIGLMRAPRHLERQDRRLHIEHFTAGLKALAKEIKAPVLALSQLNRQVESRDPPIPRLSDLRESGSIEQDADVVMFAYRPEYYLERRKPRADEDRIGWQAKLDQARNTMDVIVDKNRHGSIGTVTVFCQVGLNRFGDLERREEVL